MRKFMGYVLMSSEELDQVHWDWDRRYLKLSQDFVRVDLELRKLKSDDPNRPSSILNNIFQSSEQKVSEDVED